MNRPPAPGRARNIEYPTTPSRVLPNGLELLCIPDHRIPRISLQAALPTGKISDPPALLGLTEITAEMLKEGTEGWSSRKLAERFDRLAIHYDSSVYMEYGVLTMDFVTSALEEALDLMAELLRRPVFPQEELAKVLVRYRGYLRSQMSNPEYLATERLFLDLFREHPYSKVTMRPAHLGGIDRTAVVDHYVRLCRPSGFRLLLAGDVHPEDMEELIRSRLGDWEGESPSPPVQEVPPEPGEIRVSLVHRPNSAQAKVLVGTHGPSRTSADYLPFTLMNQVLGGGGSSRIFLNLREEKGLTYGAYSGYRGYRHSGIFFSGASVRSDSTRVCIDEIFGEIDRIRRNPPAGEELARCKSELAGSFLRQMETPSGIGSLELTRRIYGLPEDFYQNYLPRLRSVNASQVEEQIVRYRPLKQSRVVVVADRGQVEGQLSGLGPIQYYNVEGETID